MTMKNRTHCMIIALLLCGAAQALAQTMPSTPQHVPLEKTIGQAKPEIVPSLIVLNANGAGLQGGKLTLTGVAPNSIVFADRPVRAAGHSLTTHLLEEWSPTMIAMRALPRIRRTPPSRCSARTIRPATEDCTSVRSGWRVNREVDLS